MVETITDILEEMNFSVGAASDGHGAVEMVRDGSYDAVIMDIRMPGMDGIEALRRIKAIKPRSKVILMSAYAPDEVVLVARFEGASTVLCKPLDIDKLVAMLAPE